MIYRMPWISIVGVSVLLTAIAFVIARSMMLP
jgi:hypothetical protein